VLNNNIRRIQNSTSVFPDMVFRLVTSWKEGPQRVTLRTGQEFQNFDSVVSFFFLFFSFFWRCVTDALFLSNNFFGSFFFLSFFLSFFLLLLQIQDLPGIKEKLPQFPSLLLQDQTACSKEMIALLVDVLHSIPPYSLSVRGSLFLELNFFLSFFLCST